MMKRANSNENPHPEPRPSLVTMPTGREAGRVSGTDTARSVAPKKIWIDLENSPHVPFFRPIISELEGRGHSVMLTARDCFQVCGLADMFQMKYKRIGRHYGKRTLAKVAGLGIRMLQMTPDVLREKPDLALSHGSRSMFLLASILGIPTLTIFDYEHASWIGFVKPTWVMAPEVIPENSLNAIGIKPDRVMRYPGIKEDVYAPSFSPDPSILERLGLDGKKLVVTVRPPASEAHYHNEESEVLLDAVFELIRRNRSVVAVILPRTVKQEEELRQRFPDLFQERKAIVPEQVVDGMDLIWFSDLVISGGGTMNREAAALGVPVYSIFRGKIGAVDHYLAKTGRLTLLKSSEDVLHRIDLVKRSGTTQCIAARKDTLHTVTNNIIKALESTC